MADESIVFSLDLPLFNLLFPVSHSALEITCRTLSHGFDFMPALLQQRPIRRNRNYQSAQMGRDHGQAEAEKIVQQGLERFGLSESDLESLPGSDPRKVAIAGSIHQSTTTPQGWTAERLQMRSAANVSQQLSRAKKACKAENQASKTSYLVRIC